MLIFRKKSKNEARLELRHQRSCDAVCDWMIHKDRPMDPNHKPLDYVYKMIETMLPKASYEECN